MVGLWGSDDYFQVTFLLKLLLHCNGADESTTTKDFSYSNHTVNFKVTAQLDTAVYKWGTASLLLDGDSDYLDVDDSADWDISTNFTIDFWVKHTDHAGNEVYLSHNEGADDRWYIIHIHGTGINFGIISGGTTIVQVSCAEITDTNWHHVALCKVGNEYGLYKDGNQLGYTSDSDIDSFTGTLYIGQRGNSAVYFDGHMDEIRIQHSNIFGAAPNATPDDTITVPTSPYSWDYSFIGAIF